MKTPYYPSSDDVEALVEAFIAKKLPKEAWTHEAHLAACVWHLLRHTTTETLLFLRSRIITYNESVGGVNGLDSGYHETLTVFWIEAVNAFLQQADRTQPLHLLCQELFNGPYADRTLPLKFYDRQTVFSTEARARFVSPDLQSLDTL
ncbi:MAG: hypothetical protein U0Y10_03875 [Spirosomataceae bacterium]